MKRRVGHAPPDSSAMLNVGKILFAAGLVVALLSAVGGATGFAGAALGLLCGLGAITWMLGSIEERLIEIRKALAGKLTDPARPAEG